MPLRVAHLTQQAWCVTALAVVLKLSPENDSNYMGLYT